VIVIDLGCAPHHVPSVEHLVERFHPEVLYGFDPLLSRASTRHVDGTHCVLSRSAAWTHDGHVAVHDAGWGTRVADDPEGTAPCIDIAAFIAGLLPAEIVLKLDVEGSEYPILERLKAEGLDRSLQLVLIEWHGEERIRLRCPVEEWDR
jgi:hypothetical protein